ncbi:Alpha-ketoglutarate-dependent taurine dioxygenase [Leucoagaricus sp. SymC.cos]|nr:Alpha-ketoglutarate-dependent taurine dioxygenase [Leucoagaricus sp. SymC.cos]
MPARISTSSVTPLGSLAQFKNYDSTPVIGTVFPDKGTQLSKILEAPNADELRRDLAALASHHGVVVFKDQDIATEQQKKLVQRMGELTGKPTTTKLHKLPNMKGDPEAWREVTIISSGTRVIGCRPVRFEWITDDPKRCTWVSGYEAYGRLSPSFQKLLEGLTAIHVIRGTVLAQLYDMFGVDPSQELGAPENIGDEMTACIVMSSPVVRTSPVTGFKSLFANKTFTKRINELSPDESDYILEDLWRHFAENYDLQVRHRWELNDVVIWDNRVAVHSATNDYTGHREGKRVLSLGEKPYFDPESRSRSEALSYGAGKSSAKL